MSNTANTVVFRDGSGNFTAGTVTAALSGNASSASFLNTIRETTSSGTMFPTFVFSDAPGNKGYKYDNGFTYVPSTGTLTSDKFAGNISSCTGYAYGNLTGTPSIPTHTSQLTNNSGFVTSSGFVNGNALSATTGTFSSTITSAGDIIAYYSSDERLKDNVQVIDGALEKVSKLRGVEFDWNDKQDTYEGHDIGVIAQDVEAVAPELVQTREDGFKAVKYEKLTALLIEAVKELKEENKQIRDELEKLRSINS